MFNNHNIRIRPNKKKYFCDVIQINHITMHCCDFGKDYASSVLKKAAFS